MYVYISKILRGDKKTANYNFVLSQTMKRAADCSQSKSVCPSRRSCCFVFRLRWEFIKENKGDILEIAFFLGR